MPKQAIVSKISGNQIIRTSASANINLGRGGTYQITVGIERVQKARFIGAGIWFGRSRWDKKGSRRSGQIACQIPRVLSYRPFPASDHPE
jgi:hypothetical protein